MEQLLIRPKKKSIKPVSIPLIPKVLIVQSVNWISGAELPFLFKTAGCRVDIFCQKNSWLATNNFFDKLISFDAKTDCIEEKLVDIIKDSQSDYDWIVLADDPLLHRMNSYLYEDESDIAYKILPLTNLQHRDIVGSKVGFARFCEQYNLLSPTTIVLKQKEDIEMVSNRIEYPVIVKEDVGHAGVSTCICYNREELIANLKDRRNTNNLIIQKYITGKLTFVDALFRDGELLMYNYSEKLKTLGNEFSISTQRRFSADKAVEPELIKLGRCAGLNGFASISYIYEPQTQLHYLIEADLRPNSWFAYGRFTGADFSLAIKKYVNPDFKLTHHTNRAVEKPITVAMFYNDLRRCIYKRDVVGLFKWVFNYNNRWQYIPHYDRQLVKKQFRDLGKALLGALVPKRMKKVVYP